MNRKTDENTFYKAISGILNQICNEEFVQKARKADKIFHYIVIFAILFLILIKVIIKTVFEGYFS